MRPHADGMTGKPRDAGESDARQYPLCLRNDDQPQRLAAAILEKKYVELTLQNHPHNKLLKDVEGHRFKVVCKQILTDMHHLLKGD